jgi:hypothetical protein
VPPLLRRRVFDQGIAGRDPGRIDHIGQYHALGITPQAYAEEKLLALAAIAFEEVRNRKPTHGLGDVVHISRGAMGLPLSIAKIRLLLSAGMGVPVEGSTTESGELARLISVA